MKTERLYLRISPEDKNTLQKLADKKYRGSLSSLFDEFIKEKCREVRLNGGETWRDE